VSPGPRDKLGWVYFIACKETRRCKIGFTTGDPEKRMRSLQTGAAGELRFIAKQPGTVELERKLHQRFASQRLHGEWFEMNEEIFDYICAVVWITARLSLKTNMLIEDWVLVGLRMMHDGVFDLPDDLYALIAEAEPA
jgi:hypothetical protein